ncbi:Ig-like domain-containing protein [Azotobacter sp. CWF10]
MQVVNYMPRDVNGIAPVVIIDTAALDIDPNKEGIQVLEGAVLDVQAAVSDDVQVSEVEVFVDGERVSTDGSYPFELRAAMPKITGEGSNILTLQVRAVDTGGNFGLSELLTVELSPDVIPPTLTRSNIEEGDLVGSTFRTLRFSFSEPLDETLVESTAFRLIGPDEQILTPETMLFRDGDRTVQLTFEPLASGNYRIEIDASAIIDRAGNALGNETLITHFQAGEFSAEWITPEGGNWSDAANWSSGKVPGEDDDVFVPALADGATIDLGSTPITVGSIRSQASDWSISDYRQTFTVLQQASLQQLTIEEGAFVADGQANVQSLNLNSGEVVVNALFSVAQKLVWSYGDLKGDGVLRLGSSSTALLDGEQTLESTLEIAGSAVMQEGNTFDVGNYTWDGERYVDDAGELKVLSGGRLELQSEVDLYGSTSGAEGAPRSVLDIAEGAALAKTGEGTSTLYSSALDVTNAGQVTVESGTLQVQNLSNSGSVSVAAGAALTLGYSGGASRFAAGSTLTVDGLLEVAGGAVELEAGVLTNAERLSVASGTLSLASAASVSELTLSSGELGGAGRVDVVESLDWTGGTLSGELTVRSGASASLGYADNGYGSGTLTGAMEVAGSAVLQENSTFYLGSSTWDGERYVDDAGELKVLSGGRLELQGEGDLYGSTSGAEGRRARCSTSPRAPRWSRLARERAILVITRLSTSRMPGR